VKSWSAQQNVWIAAGCSGWAEFYTPWRGTARTNLQAYRPRNTVLRSNRLLTIWLYVSNGQRLGTEGWRGNFSENCHLKELEKKWQYYINMNLGKHVLRLEDGWGWISIVLNDVLLRQWFWSFWLDYQKVFCIDYRVNDVSDSTHRMLHT
jgi:hypothetical protein